VGIKGGGREDKGEGEKIKGREARVVA